MSTWRTDLYGIVNRRSRVRLPSPAPLVRHEKSLHRRVGCSCFWALDIYFSRFGCRVFGSRLNITNKSARLLLQGPLVAWDRTWVSWVLLPNGFDEKDIPATLESESSWETAGLAKIKLVKALLKPTSINLAGIQETTKVEYLQTSSKKLTVHESEGSSLVVSGESEDPYLVAEAFNGWMRLKAQDVLIPWVNQISQEHALPFSKVRIGRPRTRWGSCSSSQSINLNQNLLFLRPQLISYVILHELAHTKHHNHSPAFWKHLNTILPECRRLQKETVNSYTQVPDWAWRR